MSKYDVKVYIPKDLYKKLEFIATSGKMSVAMLLGRIIKDDMTTQAIDTTYRMLMQLKEDNKNEGKALGSSRQ